MISIDEQQPSDLSSSVKQKHHHHHQQQVSHEAFASVSDIDLLKSVTDHENLDDTNNPLPKFSIRDYVFESRKKNIARNWPFSDKSLQLCLNNGVKNLLPPFQSLDSVKQYSSVSVCAVENRSPDFDGTRVTASQCHIEEDLAHTKSDSQSTVKKGKFVMKLNSGVEPIEETAASKVCPVCKTFSSSSNTTLNAHIDSCLSEESSMKCTAGSKNKAAKHKIKPRIMRSMVDIYKTAPRCTIEDLDRRNGTNWATSSSFPDQELEFQAEEETNEPQEPTVIPPVVTDQEGAVYIDKKGKKVRILSMPKGSNLDGDEARVLQQRKKGSKVVIKKNEKKAPMQKNVKKISKLGPKSKKAESGQKENVATKESREKEVEGAVKHMKAHANKQMDDLTITRPPWACSKRTNLTKKRSPVHTKQNKGTSVDDSCENPIRSKGSKFSSLEKSLSMPASRERSQEPKLINLKRKFAALGKSQESLKQKSRMEEDTSKSMSSEMMNDVEVETKKSMSLSSSNDDDDDDISGGPEIASESARTNQECIGIEPSFISKMISQLDNKFDSQQQCTLNRIDEVDPIPIPGPPGSFLPPSPGADMCSEEGRQGNSSLTTMSRVQSVEEHPHYHPDFMNQDFISGSSASTVSSPSFARSADKKPANNNNNNNASDLRSVDEIFKEKGPTPCCCSRKEVALSNNVASYNQESAVSKERATESNGSLRTELFPLKVPPPEMVLKQPAVSPTTSVIRLMGKNLHVANTHTEQVKPPSIRSPMGQQHQYQQPQKFQNENHGSFLYGHPQNHITFSHNQNGYKNQPFNLYPPNNLRSHLVDLTSENMDNTTPKEIIFIDDDSSDNNQVANHHPTHRMFKEPMIRTHASASTYANPYGNGGLQTSSPNLQQLLNDGNRGRGVPTAYYPHRFA